VTWHCRHGARSTPVKFLDRPARLLVILLLLFGMSRVDAIDYPAPYRMTFLLTSDGTEIGNLVQSFEPIEENRYRYTSRLEPAGFLISLVSGTIEESTLLERDNGRLRPLSYRFSRVGLGRDREVRIIFDWAAGRARNDVNGEAWSMEIPVDALDKHSLVLAVAADLAAGTLRDEYPVADGGRLKVYAHLRRGEERLETPLGTFDTVMLYRQRTGRKRGTLFWHAPELDYMPVRIERFDKAGRHLELRLLALERLTPQATVQPGVK